MLEWPPNFWIVKLSAPDSPRRVKYECLKVVEPESREGILGFNHHAIMLTFYGVVSDVVLDVSIFWKDPTEMGLTCCFIIRPREPEHASSRASSALL